MGSLARLVVHLGAKTSDFETDMKRAAGISKTQMRKMERDAKRLNDTWNRNFRLAGAAVVGGLALATKAAMDFEKSMAEISTLLDGDIGLRDLEKSVKDVSIAFGQSPVQEAKALYQIISSGAQGAAKQTELLVAANKLAVGGMTDVATAADGLTSVYNAYAGTGLEVNEITDIMFETMRRGKTTIEELNSSIGNVATIAAQTGLEFDQLGAAVATVTGAGVNTSQAVDGLRGVLSALLKQTDKTKKAAADLGIEFNIARLKLVGFDGIMQDIANSGATEEQLSQLIGRVEGLTTWMAAATQGGAKFAENLEAMRKSAGAAEIAVAKVMETASFKADQARAALENLGIEIGTRFLASISKAATFFVDNIDKIIKAVEIMSAIIIARVGVGVVAAFTSAAAASTLLATSMAIVGGAMGAWVLAGVALVANLSVWLPGIYELSDAYGLLKKSINETTQAWIDQASAADIASRAMALNEQAIRVAKELEQVQARIVKERGRFVRWTKTLDDLIIKEGALKVELEKTIDTLKALSAGEKAAEEAGRGLSKSTGILATAFESMNDGMQMGMKHLKERAKRLNSLDNAQRKAVPTMQKINRLMSEANTIVDDLVREQNAYEASLKSILDALFPLEAAMENYNDQIDLLTTAYQRGDISVGRYTLGMQKIAEAMAKTQAEARNTGEEFNLMATAIDEGVRILERTFTTLWSNLLDGSTKAFSGIASGFKALMANLIHQATTQQIMINIQQGLQPGGQINFQKLGTDLANFAAVIAGTAIGGGGTGAVVGAALGTALGQFLIPIPVLGALIGGALGGVLGGLLDKIFGKDKTPRIGAASFDIKPGDTTFFDTAFGGVFVGDTKGGMDDFVDEFGKGIKDFDNAIAAFLDADAIGAISDALKGWGAELRGDAISIEQLLGSRFATIMTTFSEGIQNFVNQGADLAAQADRLQIGVTAENILGTAPGFEGRTVTDILNVVEAMRTGTKSISDAFNEFVNLLTVVLSVKEALQDFAGSDLGGDFQALLDLSNISLQEAVTGMTSGLMDAINSFDGSPEQLQNIGAMVASVRQGELALLSEIDAIQKGIQANLATLKADLTGLRDGPASDEQLFKDAQGFINAINTASSAEEIAALERQFDAAIRAMSPESQMSNMTSILAMIDNFSSAADTALEGMKQAVIDSGADTRAMVDAFIERIGDPLDIIASTNEAIAEALTGESGIEGVQAQNEMHEGNMENILETGVSNITGEVANIGPVIRNALQGINVNVIVQTEDGLVTQ